MRSATILMFACTSSLVLALPAAAFIGPHVHRGPTAPHVTRHTAAPHSVKAPRAAGISTERATQIQIALVKAGYLSGSASGQWDAGTQAALVKMQSENGWQTKLVPDSRAIIKLGLGPGSSVPAADGSVVAAAQSDTASEPNPAIESNR